MDMSWYERITLDELYTEKNPDRDNPHEFHLHIENKDINECQLLLTIKRQITVSMKLTEIDNQ